MADGFDTIGGASAPVVNKGGDLPFAGATRTLDEARALARERFKEKLTTGEKIGDCNCHADEAPTAPERIVGPSARVVGVRFRDSGRMYYFDAREIRLHPGDWVVVETSRGREAGRVVIAPHQIALAKLQGDLKPILRRLDDTDVQRMDALKGDAARAIRTFNTLGRTRRLPVKPISADYNFDGSVLVMNYTTSDRVDLSELAHELAAKFDCRVELRQVGPRDEARLLGGLGRCGRTLCCSSWLPVYPEISMGMAKTQDLSLNPSKVSGVCGRLLCCLSYENEQYKQMKAVLPRLGQQIDTPAGPGLVVSLQVIKELVTVRLAETNQDVVFPGTDLGLGAGPRGTSPASVGIGAPLPTAAPHAAPPDVAARVAPVPALTAILTPTTEPDQPPTPVTAGEFAAAEETCASANEEVEPRSGTRRRRRRRGRGGQRPTESG